MTFSAGDYSHFKSPSHHGGNVLDHDSCSLADVSCSQFSVIKLSQRYQRTVQQLQDTVMVDAKLSNPFEVTTGVLHGDVFVPFPFIMLLDYLMRRTTEDIESGIVTHPRQSRRDWPAFN